MHVIYIHQYYNSIGMPGSTRSYEMARRLVERGHRVSIVTSWRDTAETKDWFQTVEDGIEIHWLPVPYNNRMANFSRIKAFLRFSICSARKARSIKGDVVFATSTPLTIAIPGVYSSYCQDIPMVFEVRDLWPEMPIVVGALRNPLLIRAAKWFESFVYRQSAHVVALSPGMAEGVIETGYPADKVSVIPNAADLDMFSPVSDQSNNRFLAAHPEFSDRPFLLYAGTLGKLNGVTYLARLAGALSDKGSDCNVLVIGDGAERERIEKDAQKLGVWGKNFHLLEPLTKSFVADAFRAATCVTATFVDLPEMEKNSANKFFDGLASGKPILINYGGWQADLINSHGFGLVLDRNAREAARQVVALLASPTATAEMGLNARKTAEDLFDREKLALELETVLTDVVKTASGPDG